MFLAETPASERHVNAQRDKRRLVFPLCWYVLCRTTIHAWLRLT